MQRSTVLALTALTLLAATPTPATENVRHASAGAACHAANGGAAGKFTYANNYLTNIGTTDQYVICNLPMDDVAVTEIRPTYLSVSARAGGTAGTLTCVAQEGRYDEGSNQVFASVARSQAFIANQIFTLVWSEGVQRGSYDDVLTLNCKVPPGFKMGLIRYRATY